MHLFKVAAGKPICDMGDRTLKSGHLERPAKIFSSIFFSSFIGGGNPRCCSGIISGTNGHLGRTTDLP
jgi:hypothetical protein